MRPALLRRLLRRQQHQQQHQQYTRGQRQLHHFLRTAGAKGRNYGSSLVVCCLALAALATTATTPPAIAAAAGRGKEEEDEENEGDEEVVVMPAEDFLAHGRRLSVRVSPWLSAEQQGPTHPPRRGRRRPRPGAAVPQPDGEEGVEWRQRPSSKYVIVGLGVTGSAALRALLACEPDAEVTVVEAGSAPVGFDAAAAEGRRRKGGWLGSASSGKLTYLWNTAVSAFDADGRALYLSDGSRLGFGKCLLAVGDGRPGVPARFVDPVAADRCVCVCILMIIWCVHVLIYIV